MVYRWFMFVSTTLFVFFSYGECKLPLMRLAQRTDDSGKVPFCKLISSDGEEISGVPWSEALETRVEHGEKPWENDDFMMEYDDFQ